MVKPEMIPDEVVKAALLTDERLGMRTVIAAALDAWPGVRMMVDIDTGNDSALKLPLPTEKSDD